MLSPGATTKKGKEEIVYETSESGSSEARLARYFINNLERLRRLFPGWTWAPGQGIIKDSAVPTHCTRLPLLQVTGQPWKRNP